MRLLICGSRHWTDPTLIASVLDAFQPELVIEGEAPGADRIAKAEAWKRGLPTAGFAANWDYYGPRVAGHMRNEWMMTFGTPTHGAAFSTKPYPWTPGTASMIEILLRNDVPVLMTDPERLFEWITEIPT